MMWIMRVQHKLSFYPGRNALKTAFVNKAVIDKHRIAPYSCFIRHDPDSVSIAAVINVF